MAAVLRSDSFSSRPVLLGRLSNPASGIKGACTKAVKTGLGAASAARSAACDASSKLAALPVLLGRCNAPPPNLKAGLDEMKTARPAGEDCLARADGPSLEVVEIQEASSPEEETRRLALEAQRAVKERRALRASRSVRLDDRTEL